jgi:sugar lactone lactonase YvrE
MCVAFAVSAQAQSNYEPYAFTTLAGLTGASATTDGTGSAARFESPAGVAVDSAGNVYVADNAAFNIRKITPAAVTTTLAGLANFSGSTDGTGSAARFWLPVGVAVDAGSPANVYVADTNNQTIRKVTAAGVVTTVAGQVGVNGSADGTGSAAQFFDPFGVAVDAAGNVYVADFTNRTIRKITPSGAVSTLAGLAGNAGSGDGTGSAARFGSPAAITVDAAGNLYVTDAFYSTIRKVTPGGVVTTLVGSPGLTGSTDGVGVNARFKNPKAIAVDNTGNLFVADTGNNTIRKVTQAGVVTTIAGVPGTEGSTDGSGSMALFKSPAGIAVDSGGTIYVGDSRNNTIRKAVAVPMPCVAPPSGLVGWWPGDNNANDIQSGNNGTLQGAVIFTAGKVNAAFSFDGTGGYVNVADAPNLNSTTATWNFWLQTTQSGTPVGIIGKHDAAGSTHGFTIILQPQGVITAQIKNSSSGVATELTGTKLVNDGQFHHIALALQSGGTSVLYIDGVAETTQTTLPFTYNATPIRFGRVLDTSWTPLKGALDEIQYFSRLVSQSEIQSIYNAGSGGNCKLPVITSPLVSKAIVGQQFIYQLEATRATSFAASNLPSGLTYSASLGAITGLPSAAGTFQVGLSASNAVGTVTGTLTITVQPAPPSGPIIMNSTSATGRVGQPFTFRVITSGSGPASRASATDLPPGLSIDPVSGVIFGTPTTAGSSAVTLTVTDGAFTTNSILELTFTSDPALPVIAGSDTVLLTPGQFVSYTISAPSSADPSDPTLYTLIGTLPAGLGFDPNTGIISGTYTGVLERNAQRSPLAPNLAGGALLGSVQLFATNSHGTSTFQLLFLASPSGAVNISTRLLVGTGENVLIGGFIITGDAPKVVIARAIGPSTGVPGALEDPVLELHDSLGHVVVNDNWKDSQKDLIIASTVPPLDDRESAIIIALDPGNYTAIVAGKDGATGIALAEVYDLGTASLATSATAKLANISTRGSVQTGNNVMIGGFIVQRTDTKVIVRVIGPSLSRSGVEGTLQDPVLELHDGSGSLIVANDDWRSTQEQQIIDTTVPPPDDHESAIVATLSPGSYTAIVRGKNNSTGVALVEVYGLH